MKTYSLSQLLYGENESLLLEQVWFTAPSCETVLETPSAASSLRDKESVFQRPVATMGAIPPLPIAALGSPFTSLLPRYPPSTYQGATSHPFLTLHHSSGALPLLLPPWSTDRGGDKQEGLPGVPATVL